MFHPAVAGLPIERLLGPIRRSDGVRRVATQLGWYAAMATAGRARVLAHFTQAQVAAATAQVYRQILQS